jgi:radical SAM protein with 4Fe4S-binding SPASM domain
MNVLRKEFNGCVVYHPKFKKYLFGDESTYLILSGKSNQQIAGTTGCDIEEIEELRRELTGLGIFPDNTISLNNDYPEHCLSAPLRVFLDFTYKCNLKCKHCFTDSGNQRNFELTLEEKKAIIDQMIDMGCYRISLAGGEPLISPHFSEFVRYAVDRNVDVSFTTNGTLFNDKIINLMNEVKMKTVTISIDGGTRESHEKIRGRGTFDKTINKIKYLRKNYDGKIALRLTMMKTNKDEVEQFIALADSLGCDKAKLNCIRPTGRAALNTELMINRNQYVEIVKRAIECRKNYPSLDIVLPLNPYDGCENDFIEDLGFGCVAGKDSMTIFPMGQIKACSQLDDDFVAGNAKLDSLQDIWINSSKFNFFRTMPGNSTCSSCHLYDMCRGGCRYRALKAYGDIDEVDPFCFANVQKQFNGRWNNDQNNRIQWG